MRPPVQDSAVTIVRFTRLRFVTSCCARVTSLSSTQIGSVIAGDPRVCAALKRSARTRINVGTGTRFMGWQALARARARALQRKGFTKPARSSITLRGKARSSGGLVSETAQQRDLVRLAD